MEYETPVPVFVKVLRDCQLEMLQIWSPRTEHAGALNVRVLLQLGRYVSSEIHGKEIVESHPSRCDIPAYDDGKWGCGFGGLVSSNLSVKLTIENEERRSRSCSNHIQGQVIRTHTRIELRSLRVDSARKGVEVLAASSLQGSDRWFDAVFDQRRDQPYDHLCAPSNE